MFHGNDHKVTYDDTENTLAVLIPRSEVATLDVRVHRIHVFCRLTVPRKR